MMIELWGLPLIQSSCMTRTFLIPLSKVVWNNPMVYTLGKHRHMEFSDTKRKVIMIVVTAVFIV